MAVKLTNEYLTPAQIRAFLPLHLRVWYAVWFWTIRLLRLKFKCAYCGLDTKVTPMWNPFHPIRQWSPAVCFREKCLDKHCDDVEKRARL